MFAVGGFSFAGSAPNQGILFVQLKDFAERPGEEHSAKAHRRPAVRRVQPDHRRDGHSVPAAVDPGPRPVRRLHLRAARSERRADRGPRGGGAAADRAGEPDAGAGGAVHAVHRERSAAASSTSIASRPRASACRSATSPTRCRSCSGRPTSTTSTSTTGRIASTCRPISSSDRIPATSSAIRCGPPAGG